MQIKMHISRIILAAFLFTGIYSPAKAADISALDFNGDLIGKVIPDGAVISFDNEVIGHITADGFVQNNNNDLIGGIVPQGIVISVNNDILGKVNNDGSVTSVNDNLVGKVLPNGLVVNNNYDILGAVVSPGLVYNDNGNIIGRVSGDGRFYNLSGENSGFVTAAGYVYTVNKAENKTSLAGRLISSKMVVTSSGKFLGSITPDGKVVDLKKSVIGSIHANGFVYNANGDAVGHIVENGYAFDQSGSYIGVVNYNGEVVNKDTIIGFAAFGNRVLNKDGNIIGFTVSMGATANSLDGKYLGRIIAGGTIVKGRNVIGKIGASGNVIDSTGRVIGLINRQGPVFDYLGQIRANASVNGTVFSLDGVDLGYMQKDKAYDRKEKEIGRLLGNRLIFDNSNAFIGINGINTKQVYKAKTLQISPYGYVFNENGELAGRNYDFSAIYSPEGNILSNIAANGRIENTSLSSSVRLTAAGYLIDSSDKLLGKAFSEKYVTDFFGESLGYINGTNMVVNTGNEISAKILPNGSIISLKPKEQKNDGFAGDSSLSISINGDYLGTNLADGHIKNAGETIGRISSGQYALDNMGALYGKALPFGAVVSSGDCKFLGIVSENGDARTSKGTYLGMILANEQVINETEEMIGYVITPQAVNGKNGSIIGTETPLGTVLNYKNQSLGCRDIYGKIRNAQEEIIGQVIPYTSAMDFNNKIIGYTDFSGNITDIDGKDIAFVDIDEGVYDKQGGSIGVLFKYTVAFDDNNVYLGRINPEGKVFSDGGEIIGQVEYDGSVITKDGRSGFALNDLYVYDNAGKTVGYIRKNGKVYSIMGEMKGSIYRGFVLDKKQNLIARGARDYNIRNNEQQIIGQLRLDGKVINTKNIEVGTLTENGDIIDNRGKVIAKAGALQYYQKPVEPTETIETKTDKSSIQKNSENKGEFVEDDETAYELNGADKAEENKQSDGSSFIRNLLGIAVTPGGKYLGVVNDKKEVIDDNGEIVGNVNEQGEISDTKGNVVGTFEEAKAEKPKAVNSKWWQSIAGGATVSPWDDTNNPTNVGVAGGVGPGGRYNPKRAEILRQQFQNRRENLSGTKITNGNDLTSYTGWQDNWGGGDISGSWARSISTLRVDMSNMITADKPIPAILARSIISIGGDSSDIGPITAIVERNVYGNTGRNVIIPAGSRVLGGISSNNSLNSEGRDDGATGGLKIQLTWDRIIRPDGIVFTIANAKTGDAEGRNGGAVGYVDEQLLKKYTIPLLGTIASSAVAYMTAANEDATGEVETSKQQAATDARENFLDKMDEILNQILESKSAIQTVTYIPAGTRIIIYPMADLWLRTLKDEQRLGDSNRYSKPDVLLDPDDDEGGGGGGSQPKVQGQNNAQNNNGQLMDSPNQQNTQKTSQTSGALPPPAADGSGMQYPSEEDFDDGEVSLF